MSRHKTYSYAFYDMFRKKKKLKNKICPPFLFNNLSNVQTTAQNFIKTFNKSQYLYINIKRLLTKKKVNNLPQTVFHFQHILPLN